MASALRANPIAAAGLQDETRAYLVIDPEGVIVDAVGGSRELLGCDPAALVATRVDEHATLVAPPPSGLGLQEPLARMLAETAGEPGRAHVLSQVGPTARTLRAKLAAIPAPSLPTPAGVLVEIEAFDTPEAGERARRTLDGDARDSAQRFRARAEQLEAGAELAGLGTFIWNLAGDDEAVQVDARYRRIHGLPPDANLSRESVRWWLGRVHSDDRVRVDEAARKALVLGGPPFREQYRFRRRLPDGTDEERWLACMGRVEFLPDGRPLRMIGTVQDVTLERQQDEMRVRLQKVEAIGTLVGAIAHDFNNVIGAILTYANVASRELESGDSPAESLREIARGANRAAEILRRLMTAAREEVPERRRFVLGNVVEEAVALLRPSFAANVEVEISVADTLPALLGDPTQLHQVLVNLLTNAAQALGEGSGRISVSVEDELVVGDSAGSSGLPAGRYARIVVSDTGPGFPAAVAHRLFDPFFTTKPAGQGTGLGLAAVQSIVAAHGGTVAAHAPSSGGATFVVHLPVTAPTALPPTPPVHGSAPDGDSGGTNPAAGARLRVLFVDDEAALVRLAHRALPREGCDVWAFADPREALAAAQHEPGAFDVLVTDLTMPQLNGLELVAALRHLRPALPVVLSSGYLSPQDEAEARRIGVNAIVSKPSSMTALAAAVHEVARG